MLVSSREWGWSAGDLVSREHVLTPRALTSACSYFPPSPFRSHCIVTDAAQHPALVEGFRRCALWSWGCQCMLAVERPRCWQRQREATAGRCPTSSSVSHCCLQLHMKCFCNIPFLYSLIFPGCSRVRGAWKRLQTSSCQIFLRCDFSECEVGSVSPVAQCTASTACVAEYENMTHVVSM